MRISSWSRKFDWLLLIIPLLLSAFSIATFYLIDSKDTDIITRQVILTLVGVLLLVLISFTDYRNFKNNSLPSIIFYIATILMLILALHSPEVRGTRAWITIFNIRFEPSEIAKLALLILLAKYFSQKHIEIYRAHHILASGIYAGIPAAITLLQSDLGSMLVFAALWIAMLLFAGINKRHLLAILMIGVIAASFSWFVFLQPYQKDRLISFINPYTDPLGSGYNTIQARNTLGSGQLIGTYLGGREDDVSVLVPEPYTDFIFSAFGQKFGLLGILIFLGITTFLLMRIGSIALRANNNFAKLYTLGFMAIIFTHICINIGMNLGIMPITGLPLPFLSYGGSHFLMLMTGLGLIESIKISNA